MAKRKKETSKKGVTQEINKTKKQEKFVESNAATPLDFITIDNLQVKNETAYKQFLALKDNPWITNKRFYRSQHDRLLNIDLLVKRGQFVKAISHLPDTEKRFVTALKFICERAYYALTRTKSMALGQRGYQISFAKQEIDDMLVLENRKADMLALFGKMWSAEEVHKECIKEWGIEVSITAIENFRTRNLDKILELQKEYTNNYKDVRLGYKKSRLEEYMWLYQETKQSFENTKNKDDRKFLKELLESIKREVEGDLIRIEGDMQVNIEHTLNVHVQKEIFAKLPINEMIMTRVALKSGVNPLLLLYRLQNSYYSKFTGFSKDGAEDTVALPEYPSSQVYDLDKLNALHDRRTSQEGQKNDTFEKFMEISSQRRDSAKTIKQIIADKLKKKKEDLESGISKVEQKTS